MPFWTKKDSKSSNKAPDKTECGHSTLAPRWDSVADMGKPDRITSYECSGCHRKFNREEGERLEQEQRARDGLPEA